MSAKTLISTKGVKVNITRPTFTVDNGGYPVPTFAAHLTGVRMWIQPRGGSEITRHSGERTERLSTGYVYADQDILESDQVAWGSRTFTVRHVRQPCEFDAAHGGYMILDLEERAHTVASGKV